MSLPDGLESTFMTSSAKLGVCCTRERKRRRSITAISQSVNAVTPTSSNKRGIADRLAGSASRWNGTHEGCRIWCLLAKLGFYVGFRVYYVAYGNV
jgi:hypothetical protein